jgi:transcriptional regulator with PAS, ATPase and Fis domain
LIRAAARLAQEAIHDRVLVGKSPVCTLVLTDREVSRRHASLRVQNGELVLMDLQSTNHTYVNNISIREVNLRGGENIRVGGTLITVTAGESSYCSLVKDASFGRMLGESCVMRTLYPMLHMVARGDFPVLLEGEPGVGKRLCAEQIHLRSKRTGNRFVSIACRSTSADELEERLFGGAHEDGGLVREAVDGTIFLDELAALPDRLQLRLLKAMTPSRGEPRFIVATRHDLDREVTAGRFREDLLAALAPTRIELPPLRDREGDVELLARSF